MSGPRRATHRLLVALLAAAAGGCASQTFLGRRGQDLADCVQAGVGVGVDLSPHVGVRATDYAVASWGAVQTARYAWRGRYGGRPGWPPGPTLHIGIPFILTYDGTPGAFLQERESADAPPPGLPSAQTYGTCATRRRYPKGWQPGPRGAIADRLWLQAGATLLFSTRLGLNPAELADFLVGWAGWDLLQDDGWQPPEPPTPPERPPEAEGKPQP